MSDAPRQPPPKREVALALLEESSMFIHLDPRRPDVLVPKGFLTQHQLVLQVGLNMAIPIPDLRVDEAGISCTLSFNRAPFWCRIPWTAVYALVGEDGRGGVWPDEVPPEIQQQKQGAAPAKGPGSKRPRPKLAAVSSSGHDGSKGDRRAGGKEDRSLDEAGDPSGPDGGLADAEPAADAESYGSNAAEDRSHQRPPEPVRVALTSVPRLTQPRAEEDGAAQGAGLDAATPRQVGGGPQTPPAPEQAPAPAPVGAAGAGKKTKREIPPYLRVIK